MEGTVLGTICGTKVRTCWQTLKPSQTSREEKIAALNNNVKLVLRYQQITERER